MKLLTVDLPGIVVRKAGKERVAVPSASNLREHHMARAGRAKKQRTAAEKRLQAQLGSKVLLVARLTRVAPRALDDDNLRPALKAYRDGVADALGLRNDRPGWLQWEYAQDKCLLGEPEFVRLEVRAVDRGDGSSVADFGGYLIEPQPPPPTGSHEWFDFNGLPCCKRCGVVKRRDGKNPPCKGVLPKVGLRTSELPPVRTKEPKPAYTPPRTVREHSMWRELATPGYTPPRTVFGQCSTPGCAGLRFSSHSTQCTGCFVDDP
jgi:hypothetical protein